MPRYIVELETGRFGDWLILEGESAEAVLDSLIPRTPTGRISKVKRAPAVRCISETIPTRERRRLAQEAGLPFPVPPWKKVRRGK